MKLKQKLIYAILGFLIGNTLLLLFVWGFTNLTNNSSTSEEITLSQALTRIKNEEVNNIVIDEDKIELIQKDDKKYFVSIDSSDASREVIFKEARAANVQSIKIEPTSSGWHWLVLLNIIPFVIAFAIIGLLIGVFIRLGKNRSMN